MRKMTGSIAAILLAGFFLLFIACGNDSRDAPPSAPAPPPSSSRELSRAEAKRLLTQSGVYPKTADTDTFKAAVFSCGPHPKLYGAQQQYIDRGLVTLTPGPVTEDRYQCGGELYRFDMGLTPLGKKYLVGENQGFIEVKKCVDDLGEVTGVASDPADSGATVEYSVVNTPTPFGEGHCGGHRTQSMHFRRYDNGWRIAQ